YIPDIGQGVVKHGAYVLSIKNISAGSGGIQAAENVHQGAFPRAGRPHQGYIFILIYVQGHALEHLEGLTTHNVALANVLQTYYRGSGHILRITFGTLK